jgi:uncharacterized protein (DUF2147 family)
MRRLLGVLACLITLCIASLADADMNSPTGLWKTIDDKTATERSFVRITENNGVYEGQIEKLFNRQPDDDPDGLCRKCDGERKDQPLVGMTILWGLKKDGEQYAGGEILDPKNGKIYRARIKLIDGGKRLEVRGYIGVSLFGRSQTWVREE